MDRQYYRIGEFAGKAAVSVRTVRFYDQQGLLSPSRYSEGGYRLYTDQDFGNLQQILALKFLNFSLEEIRALLNAGPRELPEVLAQQKTIMRARRDRLDAIILALDEAERRLAGPDGPGDWQALIRVIQAIQMEQNNDWVKKYFTPEQQQQMERLSEQSYSPDARRRLAERGDWTEADQQQISARWDALNREIARLAEAGADPSGPEAQAVAAAYRGLIGEFTGGDAEIESGLRQWWQNYGALPDGQKPFQTPYSPEQQAWLGRALAEK